MDFGYYVGDLFCKYTLGHFLSQQSCNFKNRDVIYTEKLIQIYKGSLMLSDNAFENIFKNHIFMLLV